MTDSELRFVKRKDGAGYDVCGMGDCEDPDMVIPAEHDGESVVGIAKGAFRGCGTIRSVTIEDGVEEIGANAFAYSSVKSVTVPKSVKSFKGEAFVHCRIDDVRIEDLASWCSVSFSGASANPVYFAKRLYVGEEEIHDLVIPDGVEEIGDWAFGGCRTLISVTLPKTLTRIGAQAFKRCCGIASVCNLSAIRIRKRDEAATGFVACYARYVCGADGRVDFMPYGRFEKDGYVFCEIGGGLFLTGYLGDEEELTLPVIEGRSYEIKPYAFAETGVRSVVIPSGVTAVGNDAFIECGSLESVVVGDDVRRIGEYAFYGCGSLRDVDFGNGVEEIGDLAFNGDFGLRNICLSDSLRTIGREAFNKCIGTRRVVIPGNIESIDRNAFEAVMGGGFEVRFFCYCDRYTWYRVVRNEAWADEYRPDHTRFFRDRGEAVRAMRRDYERNPDDSDDGWDDPYGRPRRGGRGRWFDE